jgi:hypothetical protein
METRERQRVRAGLDELKPYLSAYISQSVQLARGVADGDIAASLKALLVNWDSTFQVRLPRVARSWVHELIDIRNRWAHEAAFADADVERALDTMHQLSCAIGAHGAISRPSKALASLIRLSIPSGARISSVKRPSQRSAMKEIYSRSSRNNLERVIKEYAQAERDGVVARTNNTHQKSPEAYARALLSDGLKKGWLK